ncbi:unnamed protein product [Lymnaea stagnalis]|uniref:Uncharacterized protein n=1 Tax=Lymnaea stagnalis TaxID=6523 RepID=A0AAV2H8C1_LYMST
MYIMGGKMNKIVFFVFLCFIMTPSTVSAECTRLPVCEEGQYCDGEDCKACDHGFYQEQLRHKEIACKPWTVRHASENWIIVVNGSATRDVQWDCMPGYVQRTFSVKETECFPQTTTTTTSSTKAPTKNVTSTHVVTSPTTRASEVTSTKEPKLEMLSILLIIPIGLVVGVFIYCICRKKVLRSSEGNMTVEDGYGTVEGGSEKVPLIPLPATDLAKELEFQKMIKDIGFKDAMKLIRIIPDPSLQFKAQNRLQFNRTKNNDTVAYLAITLCDWLANNPAIDSTKCLAWTLEYIKNITDKFNNGNDSCNNGNGNCNRGNGEDSCNNVNNCNKGTDNCNNGTDNCDNGNGEDNCNDGNDSCNNGTDNCNNGNGNDNCNGSNDNCNHGNGEDNGNNGNDDGNDNCNNGNDDCNDGTDNYNNGNDDCNDGTDHCNNGKDDCNDGTDHCNNGNDDCNNGTDNCNNGNDDCNDGTDHCNNGNDDCNDGTDHCNNGSDDCNDGTDNCNNGNDDCNDGTDHFNNCNDDFNDGNDNCNNGNAIEGQRAQLLLPDEVQTPISTDQCFHKLCYFIVENLGVPEAEQFITILDPKLTLILRNRFDYLRRDFKEWEASFVDTLAEWKMKTSQQPPVVRRFEEILKELEQNQILDSRIYQLLIREFELSLTSHEGVLQRD